MHELAMVRGMYNVINEQIKKHDVKRVLQIRIVVGALTGVEDTTMKLCFEMYVQRTSLKGAELVIKRVPVKVRCRVCGNEYETGIPFSDCTVCGNKKMQILSGSELYIESLEVE